MEFGGRRVFGRGANEVRAAARIELHWTRGKGFVCGVAPYTLRAVASFLRRVRVGSHRDQIDTRARFVFADAGGKTTDICMDRWDLCVNG